MTEEKIYATPEYDHKPMILESDIIPTIEDIDSSSLIPETDSASMVPERNTGVTLEGTESKDGCVRRYSTGDVGIPYRSVKILSRYLAASASSCHHYCKYGHTEDIETKSTSSCILETATVRQSKGHDMGKIRPLAETKKKLAASYASCRGSRIPKPDCPSSTKKEPVKLKQLSLPIKEIDPKSRPKLPKSNSLQINRYSRIKKDGEIQENKEMASLVNSRRVLSSKEQIILGRTNEMENSMLNEKKVLARSTTSLPALRSTKKVLTRPVGSLAPRYSEKRVSGMNTEKHKSLKGVSHLRDRSAVMERNAENKAVEVTQDGNSSSLSGKDKSLKHDREGISPVGLSLPSAQKISRSTQGIHASRSPKSSDNKSWRHTKQGIHVTRASTSSMAPTKSSHIGTFSDYPKTGIDNRAANARTGPRTLRLRKDGVVRKDPESPARKLSFRKVKEVEPRTGISSPRRLKFRRRNMIDSQTYRAETARIKFKNPKIHADEGKSESEKVVLRRQDVEEKKIDKSLLNDMIEEKKNQLSGSRKSKVKALVGAFETVISLQDPRRSSIDTVGSR